MARALFACLLAVGCGRLDFNAQPSRDAAGSGVALTLSYPRSAVAAVVDASAVSLVPTVSDPAARFSIDPALPAGLQVDPSSGILSGTPSQSADAVAYTVTAATASSTASFVITLTALPGYIVDSITDAPDADTGTDAVCMTAGGACTLRAAIQTTNHRTAKQLILLDAQSYAIGSALDAITNDVEIAGQGAASTTIRGATLHAYGALVLASAHTLWLRDLTMQDFGTVSGPALNVTAGSLDVDRCAFNNNNASAGQGGVLFINGGAHATLARSTFTGNSAYGGNGWGGVIDGEGAGTTIVVTGCFATQNVTNWGAFSHITTGTTLRLENSTLYDNTSNTAGTLATPGGIYTLVNDTIVHNTNTNATPDSAGIYLYSAPCHYTVTNTLVAFNTDKTGAEHNCNRRDLTTTLTSGGGNLFSDSAENCAAYFTAPGDRLNTDPGLDATAPTDHGGLTPTFVPIAGSPTIDTGDGPSCPNTDQRGLVRPVGAGCDVGAVEVQ